MEDERGLRNEKDWRTERIEEGGGWKNRGIGEGKGSRRDRKKEGRDLKNREYTEEGRG